MHPDKAARLRALQRHEERLQRRITHLDARSNRYSWLRVFVFAAGLISGLALGLALRWWLGLLSFALGLILFSFLVAQHRRLESHLSRLRLLSRLLHDQQARLLVDWQAIAPLPGGRDLYDSDATHPFDLDLDISGPRSLHRLLNTAITREGALLLKSWLLEEAPDLATIQRRQALVGELTPLRLFRNRLQIEAHLAGGASGLARGSQLLRQLRQESPKERLRQDLTLMGSLNLLTLLLLAGQLTLHLPPWWLLGAALSILFFLLRRGDTGDLFDEAFELQRACAQLSAIFAYLERRRFPQQPHLQQLCHPFSPSESPQFSPAQALHRLSLLLSLASFGQNLLLTLLLHLVTPWEFIIALRLEAWKARLLRHLPRWLETWFELEALCSLATFADLNPDYHLPEFIPPAEAGTPFLYEGQGLGHPLLPPASKVVNDFTLRQIGSIAIITGSNMAGKSTFLRTVGINLVLANAGAPVDAVRLRLTPLRLFACSRISDALTEGYSYFYAEVRRLRALLDTAERPSPAPLLFLIDEIFRGTNNRERRIGSRAYLRALATTGRRCAGLVATHDLDLTQLAQEIAGINNYHFREEVRDGEMIFDYRLRPGPCPTTNALKIMRLLGLPVPETESDQNDGEQAATQRSADKTEAS
ncbi:DNA mismatch repair protein [Thermogemmatispora aurantia]|uniref:MutS family DNA mismatch repair protein n=1 Tax=Thermogemmatispora aurantia TaxID=2045279 RepID=UPI00124C37CF|nr:MutS family DNA mismatch repair protein [Thermogemmatispora aurantia]GER85511.1 DNA mismatch repair protein [Thermogemmatispora aurantia]